MKSLLFFAAAVATIVHAVGAEKSDFLQVRGTELYLHGKPFYEISFNKFDLFWQMRAAEFKQGGFGSDPAATAENALQNFHQLGFKTIRVVIDESREYRDPATRDRFIAVVDRLLDLCDKYDVRVVASLNLTHKHYSDLSGESFAEYVANPQTKSRAMAREYVREIVTRYRDRKTIAMWEHGNELLLKADIGGVERTWSGLRVPTLAEVAAFHEAESAFIRSLDQNHPTTSGDSYRNCLWSLYKTVQGKTKAGWAVNTMEDIGKGVSMAQKGVDVYCIHNYYKGPKFGCHPVMGADGKLTALNMADWTPIAHSEGKPLYVGEYSAMPLARNEENKKKWEDNPEWFQSYEGPDKPIAIKMVAMALEEIVKARPNLTHWWTYQSDRNSDQKNPQRFDIDLERTPELVGVVMEANRRLQMATMGFTYMKDGVFAENK